MWVSTPLSAVADTAKLVIPLILKEPPDESPPWKLKLGVTNWRSEPPSICWSASICALIAVTAIGTSCKLSSVLCEVTTISSKTAPSSAIRVGVKLNTPTIKKEKPNNFLWKYELIISPDNELLIIDVIYNLLNRYTNNLYI